MRAIIIAAGEGSRWGEYLGIPKHLAEVEGEPVLYRTVRLLKQNGVSEIIIVGPMDLRYKLDDVNLFVPVKHPEYADADKFLSSEILWNTNGRTITLFGDVFFSEEAITKIISCNRETWTVFGRQFGSIFTGTKYGEIFAHSFFPLL
jgi:choline kinase